MFDNQNNRRKKRLKFKDPAELLGHFVGHCRPFVCREAKSAAEGTTLAQPG